MTISKSIPPALIDTLLSGYQKPEDLLGENGLLKQLNKALIERAWETEMAEHLRHTQHEPEPNLVRNTHTRRHIKTFKDDVKDLSIETPYDYYGNFEPQIIAKHPARWTGFYDKIISLYANGLTTGEIKSHLQELYGAKVSLSLISSVTDAVAEEVTTWQSRPLDPIYPIVYLDCIHVKIRDTLAIQVKAVYLALGINLTGEKDVLGLWIAQNEDTEFWSEALTDLKNRGVRDIFIACSEGLNGIHEAIETLYPRTSEQLCIVHLVRNSLSFVGWKMRKQVEGDLKRIYQSATFDEAERKLAELEEKWNDAYPSIAQIWRCSWNRMISFFDYPPEIRHILYTTNAIQSVNMSLRKIAKNRGSFPNDEVLSTLFYLALMNISKKWSMPLHDWKTALNQFSIQFEERMPNHP